MAQVTGTSSTLETLAVRLARAGEDVATHRQTYEDAIALRDSIVVEALNLGYSYAQVAKAAQLSPARVVQILARAG